MRKKMIGMLGLTVLLAAILAVSGCGAKDSSAETETTQAVTTAEETESMEAPTTAEETETTEAETTVAETESTEVETTVEETESTEALQETEDALDAEAADASTEVQFGTNQNDAVLVPLNTKIYGTMSSGYYWCSFTTGSNTEADYRVSLLDKTVESRHVEAKVYDDYGTELSSGKADSSGLVTTFEAGELSANTTYYVRITSDWDQEANFMLIIRDFNQITSGIKTSDTVEAAGNKIVIATNMDDAGFAPVGAKIAASIESGYHYYAFTATVSGEYTITLVDETTSSRYIKAIVYDEYGSEVSSGGTADSSGTASSFSAGELTADTTYYIRCNSDWDQEASYTFTIHEPEDAEVQTATIEEEEEDLIFSTPFEINSTTVQFVINSDEFIDEEAAKEAVEPVAEALLAYPDHSILIAGTTATDGTQESCVKLSERRAAAVKNLLVEEFGVPESQIETIGLGYEADPFERGQDREVEGDITSKFIESEAKKNRRVVIMDIDSDIAQEILAANE
ncbi:MAG: OmpA family protein [Lachnospiraceae bacterium]|nr:OmpA family protein [Lachnospiraceae bacterium]